MIPQVQCKPVPQLFIYPTFTSGDEGEPLTLLNSEDGADLLNSEDGESLLGSENL